jgi:hypothetical protein
VKPPFTRRDSRWEAAKAVTEPALEDERPTVAPGNELRHTIDAYFADLL